MYADKLAVAVKCKGKVLRELKDTVYLPFGSEYSIFIKNLNSVKCLVTIEIDGQDIGDGTSFIIPPNSSIEIERFVKNGNLDKGNRLKFIERTARIEEARGGPQVEDGLIRIQYEFEWPSNIQLFQTNNLRSLSCNSHVTDALSISNTQTLQTYGSINASVSCSASLYSAQSNIHHVNDAGITVPGSVSDQKFTAGYIGALDGVKRVMVVKLLGEVGGKTVEQPVTVNKKPKCVTCGKVNTATAKFCSECGTSLEIV